MSRSKIVIYAAILLSLLGSCTSTTSHLNKSPRTVTLLDSGWKFRLGESPSFDDSLAESVTIPHDWAIKGPFDRNNDIQEVAVFQNFEKKATVKTGRTGGLPHIGTGWYRRSFDADTSKYQTLLFDGAMSEAKVYVNGTEVCFWPYGYNSFHCDVTPYINKSGKDNILTVRLQNRPHSSRWYPGAGLYRNVHLIETSPIHIPVWGTVITTEAVWRDSATIKVVTKIEGLTHSDKDSLPHLDIKTSLSDASGNKTPFHCESTIVFTDATSGTAMIEQFFTVYAPKLWSPESPNLYFAESQLFADGAHCDSYTTRFGIRTTAVIPEKGFFLNGENRKFKGVCLHHDLGPLGAAINKSALRHQLAILKDMGCDAIRTSHNMPSPEQIALCDEMGFMVIVENFDEWDVPKCENGYHRFFNEWAEKDMINMIHQFRNNPSVMMWCIGNEVPTQWKSDGYKIAKYLYDICKREDPTRAVTCGMDQIDAILNNGFGEIADVPGFNYRTHKYLEGYEKLPQKILLGSETSSTVSSRGVYHFPPIRQARAIHEDHQSSSYDLEFCEWSNIPDEDFALAEDYPWTMGQFVWIGFDYLGEPTPYDTDAWPSHSSLFGIMDLASIPKDRFYLYRSIWNTESPTLHILPHWSWNGHTGETIPVFVYTSYDSVELFINGKSQGIRSHNDSTLLNRYRLMWMNTKYEQGELKAVAYDSSGKKVAEEIVKTASEAHHIELSADRSTIDADGKDLAYITVSVVDKEGNLCPRSDLSIKFDTSPESSFRACANGDPTSLELFHIPQMKAFSGQLTAIVQSGNKKGQIVLKASAEGVESATIKITTK